MGEPPAGRVRTALARVLSLLAEVRPGEVVTLLLLSFTVMLLIGGYYLLKTAREPLILQGGAALKTYASGMQALFLIPVTHLMGLLSARLPRLRLMAVVAGFFVLNLLGFFLAHRAGLSIGVPFYVWVGVFNMAMVAQFWTFVADLYSVEQGRRLLAVIGLGASLGGLFGARVARASFAVTGVGGALLATAGLLLVVLALMAFIERRERRPGRPASPRSAATVPAAPATPVTSGFGLLRRDRYLQLMAALVLLLNLVNTTGEYLFDRNLVAAAQAQSALSVPHFIAAYKADFFSWVNGVGIVVQLLLVSRVIKHVGVGASLFILPVLALSGYGLLAFAPLLSVIFFAKVVENGLDYSLQATLRQALYLPTSSETKYRAKLLIDAVVVRAGDVVASLVVFGGQQLALGTPGFALVNAGVTLLWLVVAARLGSQHRRLEASVQPQMQLA